MKKKTLPSVSTIPPEIRKIFGRPPILSSEDQEGYYARMVSFAKHIRPTIDPLAWLMIKDLVDSSVEIDRHRLNKASLIDVACKPSSSTDAPTDPLRQLMAQIGTSIRPVDEDGSVQLLPKAREKAPSESEQQRAEARRAREISAPKLDPASVFSRWITGYEKLDALQCTAERRFASALYDLNHYMKGLGRDLREAGQVFE